MNLALPTSIQSIGMTLNNRYGVTKFDVSIETDIKLAYPAQVHSATWEGEHGGTCLLYLTEDGGFWEAVEIATDDGETVDILGRGHTIMEALDAFDENKRLGLTGFEGDEHGG